MEPEQSSQSPNVSIEDLPEEINIEILKYLDFKDILNISLVSRTLAQLVNENFNILTPKRFRISLNCWNESRTWIGKRKYSNFLFDSIGAMRFLRDLNDISLQIQTLTFNFHNSIEPLVDLTDVRKILQRCKNLKTLVVNLSNVTADHDDSLLELPKLDNLELLDYYGNSRYFRIFMNCELKSLKLRFYDIKDNMDVFKKFLMSQKTLKELKVFGYNRPFSHPSSIFEDDQLENVPFRLKSFKISRHPQMIIASNSFQKFLDNHRDTMTYFSSSHSEISLEMFKNFRKLRDFKAERSMISATTENTTIENVIIKRSHIQFLSKLSHLKSLKIVESISFLKELNLGMLKHLESLDISSGHIPRLIIPSVKDLNITNAITYNIEAFPLFRNNVKNLSFKNCSFVGCLYDYLNQPDTRLRNFKIENCKVEGKCLTAIKRNRQKIENLQMKGCKRVEKFLYIADEFDELYGYP